MRWRRWAALVLLGASGIVGAAEPFTVTVEGIRSATLRNNVEARLSIRAAVREQTADNPVSDRRLQALHRRAEQEFREALQPFGYYDPVITSEFDLEARRARYTLVELGPRVMVRDITLVFTGEGKDFEPLRAVQRRLQIQPGEPLRHARYNEDKNRLSQAAFEFGFLDARFTAADLWVFPDEKAADIEWVFDTGTRWAVGEIRIESDNIDEDVIRRYLLVNEGDYFSPQALLNSRFALGDLGYFDEIEIVPVREEQADGRIPLLVRTTPAKDVVYSAGIGYGTDTGARLTGGAEWRRWNSRGHKFRTDLRLSEIQNRLNADYRIPLGQRIGEHLSFSGGAAEETFDGSDSRKLDLGIGLDRRPGRWKRRLYLNLENETTIFPNRRQTSTLLIPGISFTRNEVDNEIHPRSGWNLFIDVHGANEFLLSTTTFVQTLVQARTVVPLWPSARLLLRGEYGANFNDRFAELPLSQRFFAGGDQSVRGYAFRSIGPRDPDTGVALGGEYLTTISAEIEQMVRGNIGLAAFYDAGGVDNEPGPRLLQGVGLGFRYRVPIGFINVDVAHPIDEGRGVRLHLGVRVGL